MPCSEGTTSLRAIWAASVGSAPSTGPTVATTMGWLLKSKELTCGTLPWGRFELADGLLDLDQRLLEVGAEVELGEDQRQRAARGRLHGLQPRDVGDGLLDRLADLPRDILSAGARARA